MVTIREEHRILKQNEIFYLNHPKVTRVIYSASSLAQPNTPPLEAGPLPTSKHTLLMPANELLSLSSLTHTHSSHILTRSLNILHTHTFSVLPNPAKSFFPSVFFRSPLKTFPPSLQPYYLLPSHHLLCTRLLALRFVGSSQTTLHYEVSYGYILSLSRCVICSCVSDAHSTEFGASEDTY